MDGQAFLFCESELEDTGYVYSTSQKTWHPFGIVPRFMAGWRFSTVVYGTWIVFVRMTSARPLDGPSSVAFDVSKCNWLVMPDILTAREWPCIAVVGDSLYVIGGCRELEEVPNGPLPTERIKLDRVLLATQCAQWERVGPSLARFARATSNSAGTSIYVTGGYTRTTREIKTFPFHRLVDRVR